MSDDHDWRAVTDTSLSSLASCLRECSDDLEAEIESRYAGTQHRYEVQRRRHESDMEPVKRARAMLALWKTVE